MAPAVHEVQSVSNGPWHVAHVSWHAEQLRLPSVGISYA